MKQTIKDFLKQEIATYKSYRRLDRFDQGILYAYEIALFVIERSENESK